MREGDSLEAASQALARPGAEMKGRRASGDNIHRQFPPLKAVPFALQTAGPIGEQVRLIQEDHSAVLPLGKLFGSSPETFPETGQRRFRPIRGRIDRRETLGEFEQQRRLADLSRTGQQLDARRRRFRQPLSQKFATFAVTEPELL